MFSFIAVSRYNSKQLVERKMDPTTIQHILTKRFRWDDGMRSYGPDTIYWLGEFGGFPAWPAWVRNEGNNVLEAQG